MNILESIQQQRRTLGILVDPEKLAIENFPAFAEAIQSSTSQLKIDLELGQIIFLIGGSTMENVDLDQWLNSFKKLTDFKTVLFPGSATQLSEHADGLLFLNLISGRNADYLIGQQVVAAKRLKLSNLEIVPTGYLLLDGGTITAVQRVSQTEPLCQNNMDSIIDTAFAGKLMGNDLIYLEAGSGAETPVKTAIVREVSSAVDIPLIVGGGLRTIEEIKDRFNAGARMVVIGTAIESDMNWKG